jgi:enoyl-CoA hydratase
VTAEQSYLGDPRTHPAELLEEAVASDDLYEQRIVWRGDWAVVRLGSGEKRNAVALAGWKEIASTFKRWASDGGPSVVVVRGNGAAAFSSGADIREFPELRLGIERAEPYNRVVSDAINSVATYPYPVIAMVNGLAVGGGCELAAACDVRLASSDASFGLPITRLGVVLGITETQALLRLLGPARLKWLVFSGRLITAEEARGFGLVEVVAEPSALARATVEVVLALLAGAPETARATKYLTDLCWRTKLPREAEEVASMTMMAYESAGLRERVLRFLADGTKEG